MVNLFDQLSQKSLASVRKTPYRLKSSQEIQATRQKGRSFSDQFVVLVVMTNDLEVTRVAVIASKSVGGAVQRNRCKRLLRSRVNNNWAEMKHGLDVLFIARKKLLEASPDEVDVSVRHLMGMAGLI
ncbi:MAG: ribonuclease P protein component [Anaerolineaceae bacterium]